MGIRWNWDKNNELLLIEQTSSHPYVYCDNWVLNLVFKNNNFSERFCSTLNRLNGTLLISDMNILEIIRLGDDEQFSHICNFIDSLDVGFIDTLPDRVIHRERNIFKVLGNIHEAKPWTYQIMLELLFRAHKPFQPYKVSELIIKSKEDIEAGHTIEENFERDLFPTIKKNRSNEKILNECKDRFKKKNYGVRKAYPCTEYFYCLCQDYITINETMKMENKEWHDVFHMIVPVSYCDFVFTDKRWFNFIEQTGLKNPDIAKVYKQRQIDTFFADLEQFNKL